MNGDLLGAAAADLGVKSPEQLAAIAGSQKVPGEAGSDEGLPEGTTRAHTKDECTSRVVSSYKPDKQQESASPQLHTSTPPEVLSGGLTGGSQPQAVASGLEAGINNMQAAEGVREAQDVGQAPPSPTDEATGEKGEQMPCQAGDPLCAGERWTELRQPASPPIAQHPHQQPFAPAWA